MTLKRNSTPPVVGVISKVVTILELLKSSPSGVSPRQISQHTPINRSTAYRFLEHLVREGYLIRTKEGTYRTGVKLSEFGLSNGHPTLRDLSLPVLRELWETTHETVNLAVLDGTAVLFQLVLESSHEFRLASKVGMRGPLHSSSLGKAIAAYLPPAETEKVLESLTLKRFTAHTITGIKAFRKELESVCRLGYAVDNEETYLGARAVGAPILNDRMEAIAAISVTGPVTRLTSKNLIFLARKVKEASQVISARVRL